MTSRIGRYSISGVRGSHRKKKRKAALRHKGEDKTKNKKRIIFFLSILLTFGGIFSVYGAEENRTKIKKIKLTVDSEIDEGGYCQISVKTNSGQYHISSYELLDREPEAGEEPRLCVTLDVDDGYYFPESLKKGNVSVSGAACKELEISGDLESAEVIVKLDMVTGTLKEVESAWWDSGSPGKAKWSEVAQAKYYEVKLYRGGTMADHKERVRGTGCDFYPYMDKQGTYTFKVRAVPGTSEEKKYLTEGGWCESEEQKIDKQQAEAAPRGSRNGAVSQGSQAGSGGGAGGPAASSGGITAGSGTPGTLMPPDFGWSLVQNKWKYRNLDGSFVSNGWQYINDKWYLFDMSGFMLTGWQHYGGKDYYLNSSGDMVTGWFQENRKWYYFGSDGAKASGWLDTGEDWYFLGPDGVMSTGWIKWEDRYYYMNPEDGRMLRNTYVDQRYIGPEGFWIP